jgi:spore germination cell wall hydrolase CwlJ-like protein
MGPSRVGWAISIWAPWALAFWLVVSLSARADPDPEVSAVSYPVRSVDNVNFSAGAKLIEARYAVGDDLPAVPDEIEPRFVRKRAGDPVVNRAHRGDPFVALRPGFEARAKAAMLASLDRTPPPVAGAEAGSPEVPLAYALATSTPAPVDERPTAAVAKSTSISIAKTDLSDRPGYSALINPADAPRQMRCLAEAIYFEARSEPEAGQAAVAQVVLNRVRSGIYPTTVCGVVYQDRERPFACQFSFACEGKSLKIEEPACWATATRIAEGVVKGALTDARFASAINYHAAYVRPFWAPTLKRLDRVGLHIFYAMRPGLYWAPGALNGRGDLPPLMAQAK